MKVASHNMRKAIVLVSGGLDSATVLAMAKSQGYACYALSFDYGQRHQVELQAAQRIVNHLGVIEHKIMSLDLSIIGGSALTTPDIPVPLTATPDQIPVTYVPARNSIFLTLALGWAEVLSITHIFIGANAIDYSGYPDCRPEFITAFEKMANLATKAGVEGRPFSIHAPLIWMSKAQIIQTGLQLGVDFSLTISCYQASPTGHACGLCAACRLRAQGFRDLEVTDPTCYQT